MIEIKPGRYRHYKLHQVGEALACEYVRNVGIDGAQTDMVKFVQLLRTVRSVL